MKSMAMGGRRGVPWKDRETSPERTKVWTEPRPARRVPVVYYLCRNGHLEHPHFMEVSLSSSADGLYLRDFTKRLNILRGKGMASLYSWSSKRSYKNGFVWHDISEDDFIYPAHGHEYVLKGSEIFINLDAAAASAGGESSSSAEKVSEASRSDDSSELDLVRRKKKKSQWSSLDLGEYKVYKSDLAADASTQTEDKRHRRRNSVGKNTNPNPNPIPNQNPNPEREEIEIEVSPPESSPSPETLEALIQCDGGRRISTVRSAEEQDPTAGSGYSSGRFKASAVLMQLISCGSIPAVREVGPVSGCSGRLPRGGGDSGEKETEDTDSRLLTGSGFGRIRLEDKEYFSGSLIETKKKEIGGVSEFSTTLKRSNSYNADRVSKLELAELEVEGVRAKCIPRKHKTTPRKEGSKRINVEPLPPVK